MPESDAPSDDLQFKKAEFASAGRACTLCKAPITESYYHYGGNVVCPDCAAQRAAIEEPAGAVRFGRALLYGLAAAVAGSLLFALVSLTTGYQLSLLSILVGFMVGKAIKRGAEGRGGRKYQVLAVLLTYGSITTSYIPVMVKTVRARQEKKAGERKAAQVEAAQSPQAAAEQRWSARQLAGAILFLAGVSLIAPFLYLWGDPGGGLLNALILGFGVLQAWRQTRGDPALLMGPYRVELT